MDDRFREVLSEGKVEGTTSERGGGLLRAGKPWPREVDARGCRGSIGRQGKPGQRAI